MGRQAKVKFERREDRKVRLELEKAGIAERARHIYLGLKREDVQSDIRARYEVPAPWAERPTLFAVVRKSLEHFGYDLTDIDITAKTLPGRYVVVDGRIEQEPHRIEFKADVSAEALTAARVAAGVKVKADSTHVTLN